MRPQTQASETILHVLRQQALHRGSALAHAVGDAAVTFGDLWNDVRAIAATLGRYGVESRDRCALVLPTGLDLIRLIFAVQMRRAVPIVLNPDVADVVTAGRLARLRTALVVAEPDRAAGLESQVSASGGRVVVADELTRPRSAPMIAAWPEPNDIAYLQLTAGTTGESRAAVVTHASLMASLEGSRRRLGITDTDVFASWIPLHHDFGLVRFVFGSVYAGCPSHLVPVSLTNLRPWLETMDRVRASITLDPVDSAVMCDQVKCPDVSNMLPTDIPLGFVGETLDGAGGFMPCAPAADNFLTFYAKASGPALAVTVKGANHMSFIDDVASCGVTCSFCQKPTLDNATVNALSRAYVVAFYGRYLRDNAGYDTYMTGVEAKQRYVDMGLIAIQTK